MLNLAQRPFVNRRPLRRLTMVFWVGAILLSVINLFLFWGYQSGSSDARETLRALQKQEAEQARQLDELRDEFRSFDLENQNLQVQFLNDRLRERAFPWSRLFEDLEDVLPINVRIEGMAPRNANDEQSRRRRGAGRNLTTALPSSKWIQLQLNGKARTSEDLLVFVERLFEHPSFASPDLGSENTTSDGETQFRLEVSYLVQTAEPDADLLDEEDDATETVRTTELSEGARAPGAATAPDATARGSASSTTSSSSTPATVAGAAGRTSSSAPQPTTRSAEQAATTPEAPAAGPRSAATTPAVESSEPTSGRTEEGGTAMGGAVGVPRTVAPAERVTLRETQSPGADQGGPAGRGTRSGDDGATGENRRRLDADDLEPVRRGDPGAGGRDGDDRFPVRNASGSGGSR